MLCMLVYRRIYAVSVIIGLLTTVCFSQEEKLQKTQEPGQPVISGEGDLRNPFESWFNIKLREETKQKQLQGQTKNTATKKSDLKLTGILQGKRNLAIINDEIVGEGDIIEGRKIIQISKKRVVLGKDEQKIILEIQDEF